MIVRSAFVGACLLDIGSSFVSNHSVGGYFARRTRESIYREEKYNVESRGGTFRSSWNFRNQEFSDEAAGNFAEGIPTLIVGSFLLRDYLSKPYKRRYPVSKD